MIHAGRKGCRLGLRRAQTDKKFGGGGGGRPAALSSRRDAMDPEPADDAVETLRRWLDLAVELATTGGMDFYQQVAAMTQAGIPGGVAARLVNLFPILAGRRFLAATGPLPRLADHYIVVDGAGNEQAVPLAECPFCKAIQWRLNQLDPAEIALIRMCSCEVVALNGVLTKLGPRAAEKDVATVEIEAPRMGG